MSSCRPRPWTLLEMTVWWNFWSSIVLSMMALPRCKSSWNLEYHALMDVDLMTMGPLFAVPEQWSWNKLVLLLCCIEITSCLFCLCLRAHLSRDGLDNCGRRYFHAVWACLFTILLSSGYSLTSDPRGAAVHTEMAHAYMHIMTWDNTKPWYINVVFAVWK